MKIFNAERLGKLRRLLETDRPEPTQQAERIVAMQLDVVFPSKAGVFLVVLYYLFYSGWFEPSSTRSVVQDTFKFYFLIYLVCNFVGVLCFISWRRLPTGLVQWLAFTLGLLDGLFMAGMTIVTGGFVSTVFWVFPGLIVLNALSIPLAMPQIVLNLLLSVLYLSAVLLTPTLHPPPSDDPNEIVLTGTPGHRASGWHGSNQVSHIASETPAKANKPLHPSYSNGDSPEEEIVPEQIFLRVCVLMMLTLCFYGAQVLMERQRRAAFEAGEFAARENQLRSAGRLAAEFAHQIKNPLAIISNAAYSLRRSLRESNAAAGAQIEIIQEEVARADRVITQIMGYAQLSEGHVEKLEVVEKINRAIAQIFPPAVPTGIRVEKQFAAQFPPLLMQRGHLSEILLNLLQNAREALGETGVVRVTAKCARDHTVEIAVTDDGPGIPPDKVERVFEAYFTTKEKGTGLGLAIVKHNTELYGGTVRVESKFGHGATFTVTLPAKASPKPFQT